MFPVKQRAVVRLLIVRSGGQIAFVLSREYPQNNITAFLNLHFAWMLVVQERRNDLSSHLISSPS